MVGGEEKWVYKPGLRSASKDVREEGVRVEEEGAAGVFGWCRNIVEPMGSHGRVREKGKCRRGN